SARRAAGCAAATAGTRVVGAGAAAGNGLHSISTELRLWPASPLAFSFVCSANRRIHVIDGLGTFNPPCPPRRQAATGRTADSITGCPEALRPAVPLVDIRTPPA